MISLNENIANFDEMSFVVREIRMLKKALNVARYYADYKHKCGLCIFFELVINKCFRKISISDSVDRDSSLTQIEKNEIYSLLRVHNSDSILSIEEQQYYDNERFFLKYGSIKYDVSYKKKHERNWEYTHYYHMGKDCWVNAGVHFLRQHPNGTGILKIGKQCLFGGNNKIDYAGDLVIGNGVVINEGVIILTHGHQYLGARSDYFEEETHAYYSPLTIGDNVVIGANATILANVKTIGENSIISAGLVLNRPVPANTLVTPTGMKPIPNGMRTLYLYKKED